MSKAAEVAAAVNGIESPVLQVLTTTWKSFKMEECPVSRVLFLLVKTPSSSYRLDMPAPQQDPVGQQTAQRH